MLIASGASRRSWFLDTDSSPEGSPSSLNVYRRTGPLLSNAKGMQYSCPIGFVPDSRDGSDVSTVSSAGLRLEGTILWQSQEYHRRIRGESPFLRGVGIYFQLRYNLLYASFPQLQVLFTFTCLSSLYTLIIYYHFHSFQQSLAVRRS